MMKQKTYRLLPIYIVLALITSSFTTTEKLDFETEVINNATGSIDVTIRVLSGEPEFVYSIWDGTPWENGTEIETSGNISSTEFIFRNLNSKPYYVVVTNNVGLRRVKQIKIDTSN